MPKQNQTLSKEKGNDGPKSNSRKTAMKKAWMEMFCCGEGSSGEPNLSKFNWDPKEWHPEPAIAPQPRSSMTQLERKIRKRWEIRHGMHGAGTGTGAVRSLSQSSRISSPGSVGQSSIRHSARHPGKPRDSKKDEVRVMRRQYLRDALSRSSKSQPPSPDPRPLCPEEMDASSASRRRPSAPLNMSHFTIASMPASQSAHTSRRGSYDSRDSKNSIDSKLKENKLQNPQDCGQKGSKERENKSEIPIGCDNKI
mmetsp:Transcript_17008/g.34438  ORF Transcript_17008/g.34438 Transcript_17008/m.34438 type:complete len:253 (-) Transcript_17008:402-1160(-)